MSNSDIATQISEAVTTALYPVMLENEQLREGIDEVRAMFNFEDRGWTLIQGLNNGDHVKGLDLEEVQSVSEISRTKVAASSLPKRAADLHAGYVFGNGFEVAGSERDYSKKGAPSGLVRFFENAVNQEALFSGAAKRELQYARFTDGNVILFCDTRNKTVRRIPIYEITGVLVNPDYPDEIWAWLRSWNQINRSGQSEVKQAWVYTNRYAGRRQKTITWQDESVPVFENVTAVDLRCNRQIGWTFGVPDAVAGLMWAEAYGKVMTYGQKVAEGLAKIIYKVTNTKTKPGAQNVSVKMGGDGVGQGVALGEGQDIALVNATQRSFDYTAARPLAAMAAAAWNVTNPDLLADSSASGSSYGSLNALTPGMQNAMQAMRDEWAQLYADVFEVMGFGRIPLAWPPMNEPDSYRKAQELTLYSVALTDEEYRAEVLDRLDIAGNSDEIPPMLAARGEVQKQAASPDQGRNSDAGSADSGSLNDQRTDNIESVMRQMQNEGFLRDLTSLVERMEAVNR